MAVDADLEMEVAADGSGVAGSADGADGLAGPNAVAPAHERRPAQVGIEVGARLGGAVNEEEVAIEDRVVAAAQDASGSRRQQGRAAGSNHVEPLVDTAAAARGAERSELGRVRAGAVRLRLG